MMKHTFTTTLAPALLALLLTACGGDDDGAPELKESKTYQGEGFSIEYPLDWRVVDQSEFPGGVAVGTLVAFQNNIKSAFTANVHVRKNSLDKETTSTEYARVLFKTNKETIMNFAEVAQETIEILIGEDEEAETLFTVFDGKESASADTKRFFQLAAVEEKTAYVVTGVALATDGQAVLDALAATVRSFRLE